MLRRGAVARVAGSAPERLVLVAAHASEHRGNAAGEMGHVHDEAGVAVEYPGIDQPDRRHDEGELAPDRTRRIVAVEGLREIELQRRMHEDEHAELFAFAPERLSRAHRGTC